MAEPRQRTSLKFPRQKTMRFRPEAFPRAFPGSIVSRSYRPVRSLRSLFVDFVPPHGRALVEASMTCLKKVLNRGGFSGVLAIREASWRTASASFRRSICNEHVGRR